MQGTGTHALPPNGDLPRGVDGLHGVAVSCRSSHTQGRPVAAGYAVWPMRLPPKQWDNVEGTLLLHPAPQPAVASTIGTEFVTWQPPWKSPSGGAGGFTQSAWEHAVARAPSADATVSDLSFGGLFAALDKNGDGVLSREEFAKFQPTQLATSSHSDVRPTSCDVLHAPQAVTLQGRKGQLATRSGELALQTAANPGPPPRMEELRVARQMQGWQEPETGLNGRAMDDREWTADWRRRLADLQAESAAERARLAHDVVAAGAAATGSPERCRLRSNPAPRDAGMGPGHPSAPQRQRCREDYRLLEREAVQRRMAEPERAREADEAAVQVTRNPCRPPAPTAPGVGAAGPPPPALVSSSPRWPARHTTNSPLSLSELASMEEAQGDLFSTFDVDGDGVVTREEFHQGLHAAAKATSSGGGFHEPAAARLGAFGGASSAVSLSTAELRQARHLAQIKFRQHEVWRRNSAASMIQAAWHGYGCRQEAAMRRASLRDQRHTRNGGPWSTTGPAAVAQKRMEVGAADKRRATMEAERRNYAAKKIQAYWRSVRDRRGLLSAVAQLRYKKAEQLANAKEQRRLQQEKQRDSERAKQAAREAEDAAQKSAQHAKEKELARKRFEDMERKKKEAAAVKIQGMWRAVQGRKGFAALIAKLRYARAEQIANAREAKRKEMERQREAAQAQQCAKLAAEHARDREIAQQRYELMERAKREEAATKIQGMWRACQAKQGFAALLAKLRYAEAERIATAKEKKRQELERKKAAVKAEEQAKKAAEEAAKVKAARERYEAMERVKREKEREQAAIKIQNLFRQARSKRGVASLVAQARYKKAEAVAAQKERERLTKLAKEEELRKKEEEARRREFERHKEQAKRRLAEMEEAKRHKAATKIQNMFRSHQGKKGLASTLAQLRYKKAEAKAAAEEKKRQEKERLLERQRAEKAAQLQRDREQLREKYLKMEQAKREAAAVKIQGLFRSVQGKAGLAAALAQLKYKQAEAKKAREERERQEHVRLQEEEKARKAAQARRDMEIAKEKVAKLEQVKRDTAAMKIQSLYRSVKGKRSFAAVLAQKRYQEAEAKKAKMERDRQAKMRQQEEEREQQMIERQLEAELLKLHLAVQEAENRKHAASKIQGMFRAAKAKRAIGPQLAFFRAAKKQAAEAKERRKMEEKERQLEAERSEKTRQRERDRELAQFKLAQMELGRQEKAAAKIQSLFRARLAKKGIRQLLAQIQAEKEQRVAAKRAEQLERDRQRLEAQRAKEREFAKQRAAEWIRAEKHAAAAKIQAMFRAAQGKKSVAALVAQARYKKAEAQAKKQQEKLLKEAQKAELERQRLLEEHKREKEIARQRAAKLTIAQKHAAAIKIQSLFRAVQGKKGLRSLLAQVRYKEAEKLAAKKQAQKMEQLQIAEAQRAADRELAMQRSAECDSRRKRQVEERAAIKIQALFRSHGAKVQAVALLGHAKREKEKARQAAAAKQRKAWEAERQQMQLREKERMAQRVREFEERRAATKIQASTRRFLAKRAFQALVNEQMKNMRGLQDGASIACSPSVMSPQSTLQPSISPGTSVNSETTRQWMVRDGYARATAVEEKRMRNLQQEWAPRAAKLQELLEELRTVYVKVVEEEDSKPSGTRRAQSPGAAVCTCGDVFTDDSVFCRKCGSRRLVWESSETTAAWDSPKESPAAVASVAKERKTVGNTFAAARRLRNAVPLDTLEAQRIDLGRAAPQRSRCRAKPKVAVEPVVGDWISIGAQQSFEQMDINGDGVIDRAEFNLAAARSNGHARGDVIGFVRTRDAEIRIGATLMAMRDDELLAIMDVVKRLIAKTPPGRIARNVPPELEPLFKTLGVTVVRHSDLNELATRLVGEAEQRAEFDTLHPGYL